MSCSWISQNYYTFGFHARGTFKTSYHTTEVINHQSQKVVAMATSLRPSISTMSSLKTLTPKTYPRIKQRVASCHTAEVIDSKFTCLTPHTKGTADLKGGWGTPAMFGMDQWRSRTFGRLVRWSNLPPYCLRFRKMDSLFKASRTNA